MPHFEAPQGHQYRGKCSICSHRYVRVLEIPTPRWTTYDTNRYGVDFPERATLEIRSFRCWST